MMIRTAGLVGCLVAILLAAPSLWAKAEDPLACCTQIADCGGGTTCCNWDLVAEVPCSDENTGYCKSVCVRNTEAR